MELAEVNPRGVLTQTLTDNTEVSFVPMSAISEETAAIERLEVRMLGEVRRGYTSFQEDDVLFAKITPCMENGKVALAKGLANGVGFGSTEFHVLRARTSVLPGYIYYYLRQEAVRKAAKQRMRGAAGQQRVPEQFFEEACAPFAPTSEQRRIVEVLDEADRLRSLQREAGAKVRRILPSLFADLFGTPESWRQDSCIGTAPLGNLVEIQSGGTPSKSAPTFWGGDIPWVSPKDMKLDFIEDSEDHITQAALDAGVSRTVQANSILIVVRGMILARTVPIAVVTRPVAINQDMKALAVKDGRISPLYLFAALRALGRRLLSSVSIAAHGTRKLDSEQLATLQVPIPVEHRHHEFLERYGELRRVDQIRKVAEPRIERLFSLMLQSAFSGALTAKWRSSRMKELFSEMQEQARLANLSVLGDRELTR